MKKRFLAVLLCAVMALSLGACGDSNKDDTNKNNNVKQPSITKLADYKDKLTFGSFNNVWSYQNWKNIVV